MARHHSLTIKDHLKESELFRNRLYVSIFIVIILLLVIVIRLFHLQVLNQQHYVKESDRYRIKISPIAPIRGLIFDRNGVILAQNQPTHTLEISPEHIHDFEQTLDQIDQLIDLSDDETDDARKLWSKKRKHKNIPLRFRLTHQEVAIISARLDQLPGVSITAELVREYPNGQLASHVIGGVRRIDDKDLDRLDKEDRLTHYKKSNFIGKLGVERSYEKTLHGRVGYEEIEIDADNRRVGVNEENRVLPEPGKNLYLTIDVRLQKIAEEAFGDHSGALVAIDTRDGSIVAMVSVPTYDQNLYISGMDSETLKFLNTSRTRPQLNRAVQGTYPPGSTIKPFLALAGLEYNLRTPADEVSCPGFFMLKNDERKYRCWKKEGHKHTDMDKAVVESCDVYFYDLAMSLNIDRIHAYLSHFGLGQQTGIDIEGEDKGILPSREYKHARFGQAWFPGETVIVGIGQGFTTVTPLQLATMTATMANDGIRIQPRIVYAISEPGNAESKNIIDPVYLAPVPVKKRENWDYIKRSMQRVVHSTHGTARSINKNLTYTIAGKTGTAQVKGIKQDEEYDEEKVKLEHRDHALFIAYAPADDPIIAIAVIVENGGHGGSVAAPIAAKVIHAYVTGEYP